MSWPRRLATRLEKFPPAHFSRKFTQVKPRFTLRGAASWHIRCKWCEEQLESTRSANLHMLRISTTKATARSRALHLEGQLAGPWIQELDLACKAILAVGPALTLDLREVSLIDRPGLALLASLRRRGVLLTHCSPFHTEQLRQASAIDQKITAPLP